jgi:DNA-binding transcriptional MerR regulator
MTSYQISALARLTGTPRTTLRYYEQAGLLQAGRSPSGYRLYGEQAIGRLGFIASAKRLGLPLTQIRELLAESDDGLCADVRRRLRPMLASRMADAQRRAAEFLAQADRLRQALADVDGPPHQGPCEPGCGCVQPQAGADPESAAQPIACSLSEAELNDRAGQWRRLLARATRAEQAEGAWQVYLPATLAGEAADLAAAEQRCCPFFGFTIYLAGAELRLDISAPPEAAPMLAGLFGAAGGSADDRLPVGAQGHA